MEAWLLKGELTATGWPNRGTNVLAMGADGQDNVIVAGYVSGGKLALDGQEIDPGKNRMTFVAKIAPSGTRLWMRSFVATSTEPYDVGVDASGAITVVGQFQGTIDFGLGARSSQGDSDAFVVRLAPDGTTLWDRTWGDTEFDMANAVAVAPGGDSVVVGWHKGYVDFGTGVVHAPSGQIFAVRLDATGKSLWTKGFGGSYAGSCGTRARFDGAGNLLLAGQTNPQNVPANFGGPEVKDGAFLVKLTGNGTHTFTKQFAGFGGGRGICSLAVDSSDNLFLAGSHDGEVDFGGGPLLAIYQSAGFLASFDPSGTYRWHRDLRPKAAQPYSPNALAAEVATNAVGEVFVAGNLFADSIDLGGGTVTSNPGTIGGFFAKYTSTGEYMVSKGYQNGAPYRMAVSASGQPVLGGFYLPYEGESSFGPGEGIFVTKIAP